MTSRRIIAWLGVLAFVQLSWAAPLRVDKTQSQVTVDVKATGHSFDVVLTDFAADVDVGGGADASVKSAVFRFDPKALDSDNNRRDQKLLEWIEEKTYPEARFELRRVVDGPEGTVGEGSLTLHGVIKALQKTP